MTRTRLIEKTIALMTCAMLCATLVFGGAPTAQPADRGTESMSLGTSPVVAADKDQGGNAPLFVGCPTTVLVGDGSTSGNARAPSPNFLASRAVWLITAAELAANGLQNGAQPGALGFRYSTAPSASRSGNLKFYLENTTDTGNTKSTTWATAIASMTLVSNSTQTLPASVAPFDLTFAGGSPFTYTGGGLYVAYDWTNGGTATTGTVIACNTALANGLLGANSAAATLAASAFRPETRMTPSVGFANDAAVDQVMSVGVVPNGLVGGQTVQAVVTNKGTSAVTNVNVALNVTGTNPFSDAVVVPSLAACGGAAVVTFTPVPITTAGSNTVTVSTSSDDNNANNSKAKPLEITSNQYSYKYPGSILTGGVGFTGATGSFVARFNTTSATQIDTVNLEFAAPGAQTYRVAIFADAGGVPGGALYEDAVDRTVAVGGPISIRLPSPVAVGPGSYYVGIEQTNTTNASLSFDGENPLRLGFFFLSTFPPAAWSDFAPANGFKLNVGTVLGACLEPLTVSVTPSAASTCQGGSIQFTCNVTGGTGNKTIQWTENGIDIGGATSATYTASHAGPGVFTYNCKVTDDGACTNIVDATPATGTWIANGGTCDDGNACTSPDTCVAGVCTAGPNPCDDGDACTNDLCGLSAAPGGCTYTPVNCDDSNVCTSDGCNTVTGCTYANVGGPCTDGNSCTVGDACSGGNCVAGPSPATVQFCNNTNTVIRDGASGALPYPSTISASGLGPVLCKVTVTLNSISHTWHDDMDMMLAGPVSPQNAIILSDVGGGPTTLTPVSITLDDAAAGSLPDAAPLASGTFKPTNITLGDPFPAPAPAPGGSLLSVFSGGNPNGTWSLFIVDDSAGDTGSLASWCVNLAAAPCSTIADCNDGTLCTTDICSAGTCQYTSVDCTDSNPCTQDNCDPGTGLCPHGPTNCDDVNACTTDSCDNVLGCQHVPQPLPVVTNLKFAANKHSITWDPVPGGPLYDIIYGDLGTLHSSGLTASVGGCLGDNIASAASDDTDTPGAGLGFWYLSRSRGCGGVNGTYNSGGAGQAADRDPLIPAPPVDCSRP